MFFLKRCHDKNSSPVAANIENIFFLSPLSEGHGGDSPHGECIFSFPLFLGVIGGEAPYTYKWAGGILLGNGLLIYK
jgi:hypothetical protein